MRRLGFLLYLLAATSAAQDVIVERDIMIPMRDGVRLAADVYRPAVDGVAIAEPLPLLLSRSPYSKSRERDVLAATHFARHGYVAVVQDMRGRYASEGEFTKYAVVETEDGFDTVEWLANKAYSNGQVGMWGTSYFAHTASDAAKLAPPALKAILLNEGGMANAWDHAVRHGGAFELGRELIEPGRIYRLAISPFPTANVFRKGHRIRIDISSSNFPRFDVNPNTGEPLGLNRRKVSAENTIHHSKRSPSHVLLPLLPGRPPASMPPR